jgi:hypothetical protein
LLRRGPGSPAESAGARCWRGQLAISRRLAPLVASGLHRPCMQFAPRGRPRAAGRCSSAQAPIAPSPRTAHGLAPSWPVRLVRCRHADAESVAREGGALVGYVGQQPLYAGVGRPRSWPGKGALADSSCDDAGGNRNGPHPFGATSRQEGSPRGNRQHHSFFDRLRRRSQTDRSSPTQGWKRLSGSAWDTVDPPGLRTASFVGSPGVAGATAIAHPCWTNYPPSPARGMEGPGGYTLTEAALPPPPVPRALSGKLHRAVIDGGGLLSRFCRDRHCHLRRKSGQQQEQLAMSQDPRGLRKRAARRRRPPCCKAV